LFAVLVCLNKAESQSNLSGFLTDKTGSLTDKTVRIQGKKQRRADRKAAAAAGLAAAEGDLQQVRIQHHAGHPGLTE